MVSFSYSEWLLSKLLTFHAFIAGFLIGIASLSILVWHRKTMNKFCKTILAVLCMLAFALVFVLIGLVLAFGKSPPPPSPPIPN